MKLFTTLLMSLFFFSFLPTQAQIAPGKEWDKTFGGTENDLFSSLQQTSDGGYILGGGSSSEAGGDRTQGSRGGDDYWIVKINSASNKIWDRRFGGNSDDHLNSIQQTFDGGYILGGLSSSGAGGDKTQSSQGGNDYWIIKIDTWGNKTWDKRFGGSGGDQMSALQQTSDNGFILGGYSNSDSSGDRTEPSQGEYDYWIVKTDSEGNKIWDKRFGGSDDDYLISLQQTSDGGYILGGYSQSGLSGDKTQSSQGEIDYWIVKTDTYGSKVWDKRFGGDDYDLFAFVQQTSDGGYLLAGRSHSGISGDKTEYSRGIYDYWVVKTDSAGNKMWDKRFGGSNNDHLFSASQTNDDGYVLGGYSYSGIGGDKTEENIGSSDYWIVKTDENGNKLWDKQFGGDFDDELYSVQQTIDAGYILGGASRSDIGGDKTEASQGGSDYWIVKTFPEETGCEIPSGLSSSNVKSTSALLGWENVTEAEAYRVRYRKTGMNSWSITSTPIRSQKLNGLIANTEYEWSVKSLCDAVNNIASDWSETKTFTTKPLRLENDVDEIAFNVFPNPSAGVFTVELTLNEEELMQARLEVLNIFGQVIHSDNGEIENGKLVKEIEMSNAPDGIYLVRLFINGQVYTSQISLQK